MVGSKCGATIGGIYGTESFNRRDVLRSEAVARPYRWNKIPNRGGRTLVNGTGYDIKLGKSLTWRMNSVVDLSKQINTKIGFVVWEISGNEIVIGEYAPWSNRYQIAVEGTIGTTGVRYAIYTDAGGWEKDVYRTITFDEEPTGDLLTWLEANGTRQ